MTYFVDQPSIRIDIGWGCGKPSRCSATLQILVVLTILTRSRNPDPADVIYAHSDSPLLRNALVTNQVPRTKFCGVGLFLTAPIRLNLRRSTAMRLCRTLNGQITEEALSAGLEPIREFAFSHTRKGPGDSTSGPGTPCHKADVDTLTLIPAFVISELNTAFQLLCTVVPFLVIDMIVASTLMAMGMLICRRL